MKKLSSKNICGLILISLFLLNFFLLIAIPNFVLANAGEDPYGLETTVEETDLPHDKTKDLSTIAGEIINYLFGILGTIFLIIILIGGYRWMTAGGNEEKVEAAKKIISAGIWGMIIIFLAYAITYAVLEGLGAT